MIAVSLRSSSVLLAALSAYRRVADADVREAVEFAEGYLVPEFESIGNPHAAGIVRTLLSYVRAVQSPRCPHCGGSGHTDHDHDVPCAVCVKPQDEQVRATLDLMRPHGMSAQRYYAMIYDMRREQEHYMAQPIFAEFVLAHEYESAVNVNAELVEALEAMLETHATPTEKRTTYALTKPMAAAMSRVLLERAKKSIGGIA